MGYFITIVAALLTGAFLFLSTGPLDWKLWLTFIIGLPFGYLGFIYLLMTFWGRF